MRNGAGNAALVLAVVALGRLGIARAEAPPLPLPPAARGVADAYPDEAWIIEKEHRRIRFEDDGTGRIELELAVRLLTDAGVRRWGVIQEPYNAATERLELLDVRVRKPDGSQVEAPLALVQEVTDPVASAFPVYSDDREKHLAVPDLHPGDALEYRAVWSIEHPFASGQFWYEHSIYRGEVLLDGMLEVDVPARRALELRSAPTVARTVAEAGDRRIYRFTYTSDRQGEVDAARREARRLSKRPLADLALSTFRRWEDVGAWYASLERERRLPTPAIRERAHELVHGATTEREKIEALYDFVAKSVRYVGISLGEGAFQPHTASETLVNVYGDCKDKHTLLAALLAAEGIPAYAALISTQRDVDPAVPYAQFNHIITAIPLGQGKSKGEADYLWLDTTAELGPFGWLSRSLRGKQALVVRPDGGSRLVRTPESSVVASEQTVESEGVLDTDGRLTEHTRATFRGDSELASRMAARLLSKERLHEGMGKALRQDLERYRLKAEMGEMWTSDPTATREPFTIEQDYAIAGVVGGAGKVASLTLPTGGFSSWLAPLDDLDLFDGLGDLKGPYRRRSLRSVDLPPGWRVEAPAAVAIEEPFATYRVSYEMRGRTFSIRREIEVKERLLPDACEADYDQLRKGIWSDESRVFVLTKASPAPVAAPTTSPGRLPLDLAEQNYRAGLRAAERREDAAAVESFKHAVAALPGHREAWNDLGRAYMRLGETDLAIAAFRHQVEVVPKHAFAHNNLGLALERAGRLDEAEAAYARQIEVKPEDRFAHANLGRLYLGRNKFSLAIPELEKATAIVPDSARVFLDLGHALLALGRDDQALSALEQAARIDGSAATLNAAAFALAEAGVHLDRAQEWAEAAVASEAKRIAGSAPERLEREDLELTRAFACYWDTLGWVLLGRGDVAGARRYLEAAGALVASPIVEDHLGQARERLGEKDEAMTAYAQALALPSPPPETRGRLSALVGGDERVDAFRAAAVPALGRPVHLTIASAAGEDERCCSARFLVVLGTNGRITAARFVDGSRSLAEAAPALVGSEHGFVFPGADSATLLAEDELKCSRKGDCRLLPTSRAAGRGAQGRGSPSAPASEGSSPGHESER